MADNEKPGKTDHAMGSYASGPLSSVRLSRRKTTGTAHSPQREKQANDAIVLDRSLVQMAAVHQLNKNTQSENVGGGVSWSF